MSSKSEQERAVDFAEAFLRGEINLYHFSVSQGTLEFLRASLGLRSILHFGGDDCEVARSIMKRWGFAAPVRKVDDKYIYRIDLNYSELSYIGDFLCEAIGENTSVSDFVANAFSAFDETYRSFIGAGGKENFELRGKLNLLKNKGAVG